jgi:DNA protecting protein DprA
MSSVILKAGETQPTKQGTALARSAADLLALLALPRVGAKTAIRAALTSFEFESLIDRHATSWPAALAKAHELLDDCQRQGIQVVGLFDNGYPQRLLAVHDPPPVLFVRGSIDVLHNERMVAVVGTRAPTRFGRVVTEQLTSALASEGWGIVSGLAKGIDTVAHQGALEHEVPTVAVMAGGLDRIYPQENAELATAIVDSGGALIAEVPPGAIPRRSSFVARDRLQSALAVAVIVAQTGVEGGTMHTVRSAAAQGRPVFCARPSFDDEVGTPPEDEQSTGLPVLLESPANELYNELPAWTNARRICRRLGSQPLARGVSRQDLDDMLDGLEFALMQQAPAEPAACPSTLDECYAEDGKGEDDLVYASEIAVRREPPSLFALVG